LAAAPARRRCCDPDYEDRAAAKEEFGRLRITGIRRFV
jgi:hypothetical protein